MPNSVAVLSVTATFVCKDRLITTLLSLVDTEAERHTSLFLFDCIKNAVGVIADKEGKFPFIGIVTDNGANIVGATDDSRLASAKMRLAHRCSCHTLHLVVTGRLPFDPSANPDPIESLVTRVRSFAKAVSVVILCTVLH